MVHVVTAPTWAASSQVMTTRCPAHRDAVCIISALREGLARYGAVIIREADLDGLQAATAFPNTILLEPGQDDATFRSNLAHELKHVARGPVPNGLAAMEEAKVRAETAQLMAPAAWGLSQLPGRTYDENDLQHYAARMGTDRGVIADALLGPPTMPLPRVVPRQHDQDPDSGVG
jgi:hypothetical protein